jgi:hypothetical protein
MRALFICTNHALMFNLCAVYAMAHASRAVIPKDPGGPFAQRIGVTVGGSTNWALRVGAYQTGRANPSDPKQYTIVVLNWFVVVCRRPFIYQPYCACGQGWCVLNCSLLGYGMQTTPRSPHWSMEPNTREFLAT